MNQCYSKADGMLALKYLHSSLALLEKQRDVEVFYTRTLSAVHFI
jgi:hypothetical protein